LEIATKHTHKNEGKILNIEMYSELVGSFQRVCLGTIVTIQNYNHAEAKAIAKS
jgi:hypothetical protein